MTMAAFEVGKGTQHVLGLSEAEVALSFAKTTLDQQPAGFTEG